ncbi:MAG: phosphoribosyltransferase [Candidatus Kariarchaeaceae archaeon]
MTNMLGGILSKETVPVKTHPTYNEIHKACESLRYDNRLAEFNPHLVIGLIRGGLIPSVIVSHALDDTKMEAIDYSSGDGAGDDRNKHTNKIPHFDTFNRLLIVDDICDTGNSMKEVVGEYTSRGHEVLTFALYYKESSVFKPDFIWQTIPEDSPWIIFPFEDINEERR